MDRPTIETLSDDPAVAKVQIRAFLELHAVISEEEARALLLQPCVNPGCTRGPDGARAMVDRSKRTSGACCRECMNYECTHPDCVKRAAENGWPRATHPHGSKIGAKHYGYRRTP